MTLLIDAVHQSYDRAHELERRAAAGTDDVDYCRKWARIHRTMADLALGKRDHWFSDWDSPEDSVYDNTEEP